jgi:NAD(P)-dependent dehydrogenase (short-subunit alcohol dehydrogenase family)
MAAAVARDSGVLDILINNAGSRGYVYSIDKEPEEEVLALLQVHCVGALRAARAALPFLSKSPNPLIVNVTSRFGSIIRTAEGALPGGQLSYSYRIAKAAQNMLTLCLHQELHAQGIRVCAVHPGLLATDSGPPDPDTSAEEGAERLAKWVLSAKGCVSGSYHELDTGRSQW